MAGTWSNFELAMCMFRYRTQDCFLVDDAAPFCVRLRRPTRGRVAAFVAGWSLRSQDLLRG